MEGELLQNDLIEESVRTSTQGYLSKLSEVASLVPIALYMEQEGVPSDRTKFQVVHLFDRTRTAPFAHYHRTYDVQKGQWSPWGKMDIEIPSYVSESGTNVTYIIPCVFKHRLIVFIPQVTKTTLPIPLGGPGTLAELQGRQLETTPKSVLDVQMSWSEYKDGKWTPRQLGPDRIRSDTLGERKGIAPDSKVYTEDVDSLIFAPVSIFRSKTENHAEKIIIYACVKRWRIPDPRETVDPNAQVLASKFGQFEFVSGQLVTHRSQDPAMTPSMNDKEWESSHGLGHSWSLGTSDKQVYSTQGYAVKPGKNSIYPYFKYEPFASQAATYLCNSTIAWPAPSSGASRTTVKIYSEDAFILMDQLLSREGVSGLCRILGGMTSEDTYGGPLTSAHELATPFSLYFWELGLHMPLAIADRLLQSQQYDQALAICRFVFDPLAPGKADDLSRFWKFQPFKAIKKQTLEQYYFGEVAMNTDQANRSINEWMSNPFQPHVVARSRQVAYMKWTVAKYIEILIAYGDFYFRQNTLESIPNAIQMYILAPHLYGPRGQRIPRRTEFKPHTYAMLVDKRIDSFSNAMVDLEERYPFSNQTALAKGLSSQNTEGLANVFGGASTLYFGIPSNPKTRQLGTTIDDRLFKIRHSQDINGVLRKLPLFEPPIDPGLLAQAASQGLQLSNVVADITGPMPNYRFQYLLGRALDLIGEVRVLGAALVSAKVKLDGEAYSSLRAKHESAAAATLIDLKKLALEDAKRSLNALEASGKSPAFCLQFYLQLLGLDASAVPGPKSEFQELPANIERVVDEAGVKFLPSEKEEKDKYSTANAMNIAVGSVEKLASIFHALPIVTTHATPMGCGVAFQWGPPNLGHASQAVARGLHIGADVLTYDAMTAGRKAMALRSMHDRVLQANQTGYEIKQIDKQIQAAKIRVEMAESDIRLQQE